MAVASSVFNIVSKFHFEVGSAIIGTNKLAKSVRGLESSLGNVQNQIKGLAIGGALNLTGAQVGFLGVLRKSVRAADEFKKIQQDIAQIMVANAQRIKGGPMDWSSLKNFSGRVLNNINEEALSYGINPDQFAGLFKQLLPVLAAKGIAGNNLNQAKDLTKNYLLSEDILNLGSFSGNTMMSMLEGFVAPNSVLWRRLRSETQTFKGMSPGQFTSLNPQQRLDKINKAFEEMVKDSPALADRMNLISTQLKLLTYRFSSFNSILKPIGDALHSRILNAFKSINRVIVDSVTPAIKEFSKILNLLPTNLKDSFVLFKQLASLSSDLESAHKSATRLFIAIHAISFIGFGNLIRFIKKVGTGTSFLGAKFAFIGVILKKINFINFIKVLKWIAKGAALYSVYAAIFFFVKRILTTARAIGKAMDIESGVKRMPEVVKSISNILEAFRNMISPFSSLVKRIGNSIAKFFSLTFWIGKLGNESQNASEKLLSFSKKWATFWTVIFSTIEYLFKEQFTLNIWKKSGKSLSYYMDKRLAENDKRLKESAEKSVVQANYNNYGKIEIKNQFDENMQPDRIAITMKDQLIRSLQAGTSTGSVFHTKVPGMKAVGSI